jgi:hypothetical protein
MKYVAFDPAPLISEPTVATQCHQKSTVRAAVCTFAANGP